MVVESWRPAVHGAGWTQEGMFICGAMYMMPSSRTEAETGGALESRRSGQPGQHGAGKRKGKRRLRDAPLTGSRWLSLGSPRETRQEALK